MPDPEVLRRDRPTNLIVIAAVVSAIALTVALVGVVLPAGNGSGRNDPRYWLMMLPVAVFAWSLLSFRGWAMPLLPVVLVGSPLIAAALALARPGAAAEATMLWLAAATGLVCLAVAAGLARGSALWRSRR